MRILGAGLDFEAALLDMDGLMLDTEGPAVFFWLRAASELGWEVDRSVPLSTVGLDEDGTRRRVLDSCGPRFPYDAVRDRMIELLAERERGGGPRMKAGLPELLDAFDDAGVPYAVATSTAKEEAERRLRDVGLFHRFAATAFGDEVSAGKPAPDIYLLAARRLGVEARRCIGFEDSEAGLRALAAASVPSIFVKDLIDPAPAVLAGVRLRCADLLEARDTLFGPPEGRSARESG